MEGKFDLNKASIFYRIEGDGLPLVLLHGFGEDSNVWNEQIDFLKAYCKLIIPDIPGSGRSAFKENESDAKTIDYYAECIHALLQNERINNCLMLGHSMGGYIVLAFAEKYPILKGYGFIHSTAFADSEEKKQNRKRGIEMMEEYGSYAFLKNTTPNLFADKFKAEHPERINELIESGNNFPKESLQDYYTAMMQRPDRTHVLRSSRVPVLFVIGTEDVAAPMKDVLQQVHLPEIAYIHILENTGHMGMWESTDRVNAAILQFVKDISWKE